MSTSFFGVASMSAMRPPEIGGRAPCRDAGRNERSCRDTACLQHRQRVTIIGPGKTGCMTNLLIVLVVLVVLVAVLALVVRGTRNRRLEQRREQALEHRAEAQSV